MSSNTQHSPLTSDGVITLYQGGQRSFDSISLTGQNLQEQDLSGISFTNCYLSHVNLQGTDLLQASFIDCQLINVDLSNSDIYGAKISNCTLENTTLREAMIRSTDITHCILQSVDMSRAELEDISFADSMLTDVSWENAYVQNLDLQRATLNSLNLSEVIIMYGGERYFTTGMSTQEIASIAGDRATQHILKSLYENQSSNTPMPVEKYLIGLEANLTNARMDVFTVQRFISLGADISSIHPDSLTLWMSHNER